MDTENGYWIMKGLPDDAPGCIKDFEQCIGRVTAYGFLPLFSCRIPGFSVEEHSPAGGWWTGGRSDPWEWRKLMARSEKVAYGKFFGGRAGFISLEWLPVFANWRRDGYDFDALWDDGKATARAKKVMDAFGEGESLFSFEAKRKAGFGRDGEKNFEGTVTSLQQQTYLVIRDFRQRINRNGGAYGWDIAVYSTPETVWGYDLVTSAYAEEPSASGERIKGRIRELFGASDADIRKVLG